MKRIVSFLLLITVVFASGCQRVVVLPQTDDELHPTYVEACDLLKEGDIEGAYELFNKLTGYLDTEEHLSRFAYLPVEIVKEDDGFGEGPSIYRTTYTYNDYGELISVVGVYDDDKGPGHSAKQTYSDDGRLLKSEVESEAGFSTLEFEYDKSGKLVKRVGCTVGANVGGITTYTYDDEGKLTGAVMESYLGIDTKKYESSEPYHRDVYEYSYDENGNCIKCVSSYGEVKITYTAEYNTNNLPTLVRSDDGDGFVSDTVFEYDENGRCTEIKTTHDTTIFNYAEGDLPNSAVRTPDGSAPSNLKYTYKLVYLREEPKPIPFFMDRY